MRHRRIMLLKTGVGIECQTVGVANSPVIVEEEVNRISHSKRYSGSYLAACRPRPQRADGFTLIELLVVIVITSLLLGLFSVGFGRTKDKVTYGECCTNLKNLYLALQMYMGDNNGQFPDINVTNQIQASLKIKEALQLYVKSEDIFWCPNDQEKSKHPGGSYGWCVTRDPKTSLAGVRLDLLRNPNEVIIAGEFCQGCHKPELINVLYADGHVDLVTKLEILRSFTTPLKF